MLDFLYALVTALAAAAFAQFGVTLDTGPGNQTAASNHEVHRTVHGGGDPRAPVHAVNTATNAVGLGAPPVPNVGRKGGG